MRGIDIHYIDFSQVGTQNHQRFHMGLKGSLTFLKCNVKFCVSGYIVFFCKEFS